MTDSTQEIPVVKPIHNKFFAEYICTTCNEHIGVGFGAVSERGYVTYKLQGYDVSDTFLLPFNFIGEMPEPTHVVHITRDHCPNCG